MPVAEAALGYWERTRSTGSVPRRFLVLADWLVMTASPGPPGGGLAWYADKPAWRYDVPEGAPSARMQGLGISVLIRAFSLTGDERYARTSVEAIGPLRVSVDQGGLVREVRGQRTLETFPGPRPVVPLTGWATALWALHEQACLPLAEVSASLFAEQVAALVALLDAYDLGWWSRFSLSEQEGWPDLASLAEHRRQALWLELLGRAAAEDRLLAAAARWRSQERLTHRLRLLTGWPRRRRSRA